VIPYLAISFAKPAVNWQSAQRARESSGVMNEADVAEAFSNQLMERNRQSKPAIAAL
jgi:hypothetical protein